MLWIIKTYFLKLLFPELQLVHYLYQLPLKYRTLCIYSCFFSLLLLYLFLYQSSLFSNQLQSVGILLCCNDLWRINGPWFLRGSFRCIGRSSYLLVGWFLSLIGRRLVGLEYLPFLLTVLVNESEFRVGLSKSKSEVFIISELTCLQLALHFEFQIYLFLTFYF